jgi:hypothetical protein
MRRRWTSILVLAAALLVACAGLATAYSIYPPEDRVELTLNSGFKPAKLPKEKLAPIRFDAEGTIGTNDGSPPPPLKELLFEIDRSVAIDAKGLPACGLRKIRTAETATALRVCRPAMVGKGTMDLVVAYPEQSPLPPRSTLFAFNGGVKGGVRTILIHAFLKNPVSAAIVITVKVSKIHSGPYRTKWVATIPTIAGGAGSVKEFKLDFFREFTYKGEKRSYLLAKCPTGKLHARAEMSLSDGNRLVGNFVRPCTPKG